MQIVSFNSLHGFRLEKHNFFTVKIFFWGNNPLVFLSIYSHKHRKCQRYKNTSQHVKCHLTFLTRVQVDFLTEIKCICENKYFGITLPSRDTQSYISILVRLRVLKEGLILCDFLNAFFFPVNINSFINYHPKSNNLNGSYFLFVVVQISFKFNFLESSFLKGQARTHLHQGSFIRWLIRILCARVRREILILFIQFTSTSSQAKRKIFIREGHGPVCAEFLTNHLLQKPRFSYK